MRKMFFLIQYLQFVKWRMREKVYNALNIYKLYFTNVGLKTANFPSLVYPGVLSQSEVAVLNPNVLHLGPDFLKDKFTLINTPLADSPHVELMRYIDEDKKLLECSYIKRDLSCTLDWRHPRKPKKDYIEAFRTKFLIQKTIMLNNEYEPVKVYTLGGKCYIYDGKHRAALAQYLGIPLRCVRVDCNIAYANAWFEIFRKVSTKREFEKHKRMFNVYLNN